MVFPDPTRIHLARAVDPLADALAGGMVTAGPLILVPPAGDLPSSVAAYLGSLDDEVEGVVVGGTGAVEDRVLAHVVNAVGDAPR